MAIGRELFSKSKRPTAIQCITDDVAAGLIASAHERRLLLPETLSVAGFDNFGLATRLCPALSTAALPLMSMAVAATRQVRETLEGRPVTASQQFNCNVVLRESIGKAGGNWLSATLSTRKRMVLRMDRKSRHKRSVSAAARALCLEEIGGP